MDAESSTGLRRVFRPRSCANADCGLLFRPTGPRGRHCSPACRRACPQPLPAAQSSPPASTWVPLSAEESEERKRRRVASAAAKRNSSPRRRGIDPSTSQPDYSEDEVEFQKAMDAYKRNAHRPFPTLREVLEVLRSLGYRKVIEPTEAV